ncbi:MAG TPA: hypothetical protein VG962_13260 [Steroidobacteraceae bacterium]|nr:hypothetical protein [Steroidobacteraceae bacterium]
MIRSKNHVAIVAPALALAVTASITCNCANANPVGDAFSKTKPIIDVRARYEWVDQDPLAETANATTLRARLGFETGKAWGTSLLAEGEFVGALEDNYNSTTNGKTWFPTVSDPKVDQVNRLQLTNTSIVDTTIVLGRERINIDDQRFVGNVGWRQNEQTYDAVRIINKPIKKLTLDLTYSNRVNRIFGEDSAQGVYKGKMIFANAAYDLPAGKLSAFAYLMAFDDIPTVPAAVRDSNATYGARFAGKKAAGELNISYVASYATQKDYGDNPLRFSNDYYLGELGVSFRQWSATAGVENLAGDGVVKGFTTPLATLHKFQGWADKFLTTPMNGINDKYVNAGFTAKKIGFLDTLGFVVVYHKFDSTRMSQNLGDEVDAQIAGKWQHVIATLKYADYTASATTPAAYKDTKKFWAQVEYIW